MMMSSNPSAAMQQKLEAPMPLIGIYVALASLACTLAMAADLHHGFRRNKLWFPCRHFSLNATSVTLLAVALKLPIDLTTNISAATDRLAKISSLALMTTAVGNFLPALGSMSDGDIFVNVSALAILITTVVVDACIQIVGTRSFLHRRAFLTEEALSLGLMQLLLLVLGSTAIMVPTTKKFLEAKYQEKRAGSSSQEPEAAPVNVVDKLRDLVNKYWIMAETSSPQFVVARSSACASAGTICFANALVLMQAIVRTAVDRRSLGLTSSSYGCSTKFILAVQTIGVMVGTISTSFRWFTAVRFRCSAYADDAGGRRLRDEFKVEGYWTREVVEWQESSISPIILHHEWRKLLYLVRGFLVNLILIAQIRVVLLNKLILVISCLVTNAFFKCIRRLLEKESSDQNHAGPEVSTVAWDRNLRPNSLRLEGEADLPYYLLQSIPAQVDKVVQAGRSHRPVDLIEFLGHSSFRGVVAFDSRRVPSIHDKEPNNCWSLPVVTLASIAVALPHIPENAVDQLVKDVRDGLSLVKVVEERFYGKEEWSNVSRAADYWLRVDLFREWQGIDLAAVSATSTNSVDALRRLAHDSMVIASDLKTDVPDCPMFNPANWPPKVIAANSMYRISSTVLDGWDEENALPDEEVFSQLRGTVAGILAACFTNLGRVIATMCHLKAIEEREESVREAALLLGKTEEILEFLELRDLRLPAGLDPDYGAAYIEEWRRSMEMEILQ